MVIIHFKRDRLIQRFEERFFKCLKSVLFETVYFLKILFYTTSLFELVFIVEK